MEEESSNLEDFYGVRNGVRSLWAEKMLLDFTIEVEDQEFRVHKLIMAATSDYFRAMLTGGMAESQTDRVRLEGLSPLAVSNMIQLIYTGQFCSDKPEIEELLACAMYLQIPGAIDDCRIEVSEEINPQNCFKLLAMLQTYSATDAIEETVEYIKSHFEEVYNAWRPDNMTYADVKNLVDLWQKSEWDLFVVIKHWADVDIENRLPHLNELMNSVRFALMTPEQLDAITNLALYSGFDVSWHHNVEKALRYHNLQTHAKVLHHSVQNQLKQNPHPFYFNSSMHEYYGLMKDTSCDMDWDTVGARTTWQKLKALEKPEMKYGIETFVVINNFLIVCERFSMGQKWHILDPRMMKWSSMAELRIPRCDFALVFCDKHLYVLGGCPQGTSNTLVPTDIIEKYDFETNSWSIIPSKLPHPVYKHGGAVIDGCIYVAGGSVSGGEELSTRFDCFETSTGTWHSKASLPDADEFSSEFRKIQVMEYCNEKVLFVMYRHLKMHYYSPIQNQWFNLECHGKVRGYERSNLRWHSNASLVSDGKNTLFLLNFMDKRQVYEDSSDDSVDDEWYHYRPAGFCTKWTLRGKSIEEERLLELPERRSHGKEYDRKYTRLMLLTVPPQSSTPVSIL